MAIGGTVILFVLAALGFVIWALVDAVQVPDDSMYQAGTKVVWVLVILLGGFIGAIVYLAAGRPTKERRALGARSSSEPRLPPPPPPPAS